MTNAEKYGAEIMAQQCKTGDWAVDKSTGEIKGCDETRCNNCLFLHGANNCEQYKADWLNAEYNKPKREFSEEDKAVMRALDKVQWVARDEDRTVYAYISELKPEKRNVCWKTNKMCFSLTGFTSAQFVPISWEDDEPTNRKEILGEE